ncbi:MAG: hypothetical protein ABIR37_04850 [Candidatus Saccharimonadales bacterium]
MNTNAGVQPNIPSVDENVNCEQMRIAMLDSYGLIIAGVSGDLQIRAAIVQALRETKVASRILNHYLEGGPSPEEQFLPSLVNVKLQPEHHAVDKVLDDRLINFLGSIPTVETCMNLELDEKYWIIRRPAFEKDASVDTVVTRNIIHDKIDGEPRQIAHYGVQHRFKLPEDIR